MTARVGHFYVKINSEALDFTLFRIVTFDKRKSFKTAQIFLISDLKGNYWFNRTIDSAVF